jgi:hypothetical protein
MRVKGLNSNSSYRMRLGRDGEFFRVGGGNEVARRLFRLFRR